MMYGTDYTCQHGELPGECPKGCAPTEGQAALALLATATSSADLAAQRLPPLTWAVPQLVPEGLTMIAGAPKSGKSWLALAVALAVASGGKVFGHVAITDPRPVLYFALEDGWRRLQTRQRHLLAGEPAPASLHYMIAVPPGQLRAVIDTWLTQHRTGVVIIDTLGKIRPMPRPGESAYQADYAVMSALKRLVDERPGSCLIVIHHTRKAGSGDFVDRVSGTNGIAGCADTTLVLSRERGEDSGLIEVTGRDVREETYAVTVRSGGSWELTGGSLAASRDQAAVVKTTAGLGDRSAEVIRLVCESAEEVAPAEVAKALQISNDDAGKYLRRAVAAGRLRKTGRGRYTGVRSVRTSETASDAELDFGQSDASDTHFGDES